MTELRSGSDERDAFLERALVQYRGALDLLAGVGRKVIGVCPNCWFEISDTDPYEHECPPEVPS